MAEKLVNQDSAARDSKRLDYVSLYDNETSQRIGGSIYAVDIDPTNPLGFGLRNRNLYVLRNGTTFLRPGSNSYGTIARYTDKPLVSGYVSRKNLAYIRNSAAILAANAGNGRVILFADNPNFRNYWHGTSRVFLNALFFGPNVNIPSPGAAQLSE